MINPDIVQYINCTKYDTCTKILGWRKTLFGNTIIARCCIMMSKFLSTHKLSVSLSLQCQRYAWAIVCCLIVPQCGRTRFPHFPSNFRRMKDLPCGFNAESEPVSEMTNADSAECWFSRMLIQLNAESTECWLSWMLSRLNAESTECWVIQLVTVRSIWHHL